MAAGFIHDKLDMKVYLLYLLSRMDGPVDFSALTELALAERGTEYFLFAQALAELKDSGHVTEEEDCYAVTDKGRYISADSEGSLPQVLRRRCDRRLGELNAVLRRRAQVRAQILPKEDGGFTLRLSLDDDGGNLFSLELLVPSEAEGQAMAERFQKSPERCYHSVLAVLQGREKGDTPQ